jgi:hypothetical protein
MENKTDQIFEALSAIRVTLAEHTLVLQRNTEDLAEHMRRTKALEERNEAHSKLIQDAAFPIKAFQYIGSIVIAVTGLALTIYGLVQLIQG